MIHTGQLREHVTRDSNLLIYFELTVLQTELIIPFLYHFNFFP